MKNISDLMIQKLKVLNLTNKTKTTLIEENIEGTINKERWIKDAIDLIEKNSKAMIENIKIYKILK